MPSIWTTPANLALACARGLAPYALSEIRELGFPVVEHDDDSVTTRGTMLDALRLNLHLRTAHRVLFPLARVQAKNLDHLYNHASAIPWEAWIPSNGYFTVHSAVRNDTIRDTRMPALCLKDAIVDRIRDLTGRRPDSGRDREGASVFLLWRERDLRIFIDTSGEPLSRRGYRLLPGKAPMQEALAAACVLASGWDRASPFIAPMCGSGTPAIEAALLARRRAPGLTRKHFAFMSLLGYDRPLADGRTPAEIWKITRDQAIADETPLHQMPRIVATDISRDAIRISRANARAANVESLIHFGVCDFAETTLPQGQGTIFMNPEYGERMGEIEELEPVYRRIGDWYAGHPSYTGCVFTSSPRLAHAIGSRPDEEIPFFNGRLECRLLRFNRKA